MQALAAGDFPEGRKDLLLAVDFLRDDNEPVMICHLVKLSKSLLAVSARWEALQDSHWTEPQLAELQARWERVDLVSQTEPVLRMMRALVAEAYVWARTLRDGKDFLKLRGSAPAGRLAEFEQFAKDTYERYLGFRKWKPAVLYDEELYRLQLTAAALKSAQRIAETGAVVPELGEYRHEATNVVKLHAKAMPHYIGVEAIEPDRFLTYITGVAAGETARRLTVTAIALKRYRLDHEAYPASLSELVPAYLSQVPADYMDGKPLRYRLRPDGGFLLYSVGEDGKDDGGDPTYAGSGNFNDWRNGRDFVWPRAATPKEVEEHENGGGALGR